MKKYVLRVDNYLLVNYPTIRSSGLHFYLYSLSEFFLYFLVGLLILEVATSLLDEEFKFLHDIRTYSLENKTVFVYSYLITIALATVVFFYEKLSVLNFRNYSVSFRVNLIKYFLYLIAGTITVFISIVSVNLLFAHPSHSEWEDEIRSLVQYHEYIRTDLPESSSIGVDGIISDLPMVRPYNGHLSKNELNKYLVLFKKYIDGGSDSVFQKGISSILNNYDEFYSYYRKDSKVLKILVLNIDYDYRFGWWYRFNEGEINQVALELPMRENKYLINGSCILPMGAVAICPPFFNLSVDVFHNNIPSSSH